MTNQEKLDKDELLKKLKDELDKLTVDQLMAQMATNLATLGFKHLGLPPEENAKFKDLDQARMAIDGLESFIKILERKLSKEEIQVLKSALSNLQMLFVQESGKGKSSQESKEQESRVESRESEAKKEEKPKEEIKTEDKKEEIIEEVKESKGQEAKEQESKGQPEEKKEIK